MSEYGFSGWFVMLLGMGTVFVGLVVLIYVTRLMSFMCGLKKQAPAAPAVEQAMSVASSMAAPAPSAIVNRPQFVAAVSSAIASYMGTELSGLRIHSIRRMGDAAQGGRGEMVAAVSAALATQMGGDVNGMRIHSIKRV